MRSTRGRHVAVRTQGARGLRAAVAIGLSVLLASVGLTTVAAPADAVVVNPFVLNYDQDVYGDFLEVGNGTMRCPNAGDPTDPSTTPTIPTANCGPAQARSNTTVNDNYFMRWADVDASAATFSSSTAQLTIPAGARVEYARLNWAGNTGRVKTNAGAYSAIRGCSTRQITYGTSSPVPTGSPATTPVRLAVGGAAAQPVSGTVTVDPTAAVPNSGPEYYSAYADVTANFAAAATGSPLTVGVGNVWSPEGFNCFGGWSLVLVYAYDAPTANAPLRRSVQIYDGHVRQANNEAATGVTLTGLRTATTDVRVGVTAYEGDFGIAGDQFQVNGTPVVEPSTGGVATNFFVSNAAGALSPSVANNLSVDAKTFQTSLVPSGSQSTTLNFVTTGDSYLAQNVVLSVPSPDLRLTKVPGATAARPGDQVTYTLTASNPTSVPLDSVLVQDPQYPQCNRNIGTLAPNSQVQYSCVVTMGASDISNVANGSGSDSFGEAITTTVTAPTVESITPVVDITKSLAAGSPAAFAPGAPVNFVLSVQNTGDSALSNVVVTDPVVTACARTFATLAVNETQTWTCATTAPVAGRTNTARVQATDLSGQNVQDVDDAVVPNAGSIGGRVFVDDANNGTFDGTDVGIGGVTLQLTGTAGGSPVTATTTSGAGGTWFFDGLLEGAYTVTEVQPTGYADGIDTAGASSAGTTTALAGNDAISVGLADGGTSTGTLFAERATGSISGVSYVDTDDDGVQDAGEAGISGVRVDLTGTDSAGRLINLTTFTDGDGAYSFTALRPATYAVAQTQPGGYIDGRETPGTAGGTPAAPDSITGVALTTPGQAATGYLFGDLLAASLSGAVRTDAGAPIAGVTVTLTGTDDLGQPVSATTTSASDGAFLFSGLRPGTYTVTETQPAGYGPGSALPGAGGGSAVQPDAIQNITVTSGAQSGGHVFVDTTASIAGSVYDDANADGVRGVGEAGLEGVQVIVDGTANGQAVSRVVLTAADGSYVVTGLLAGTYRVVEPTEPPGFLDGREAVGTSGGTLTPPDSVTAIGLGAAVQATGYTFGEVRPASVAGAVTAGGTGIPGVTLTLTGTDDLGAAVNRTTTTAADGTWSFATARPGTYTVTETQPAGYGDGPDTAGTAGGTAGNDVISGIVLAPGTVATGYLFTEATSSLSGSVYLDADANGVRGAGETGIAGVTVTLSGAAARTTTTAADGSWSFTGLPSGTYTVTETQPAGYVDGRESTGGGSGTLTPPDSITAITLPGGAALTGYTFGELQSTSVAGSVVSDRGPGVPGVTVTLTGTDDLGAAVSTTTTTDAAGAWAFTGLRPGTYVVTETQPFGFGAGSVVAGSAGGVVAGANQVTTIVLASGAAATGYVFTDTTSSLAGSVYLDGDANGVRGGGETGITGVTVTVTGTDAAGTPVDRTVSTDGTGAYRFDGLLAGTYTLTETQPAGYADGRESTSGASGTPTPPDSITTIALPAGQLLSGYTFGEVQAASLAGQVTVDGAGLAGVTVTLTGTDDLGAPVSVTTTTVPGGAWAFPDLRPGTYVVTETQPAGYGPGTATPGTAGGTVGGANSVTGILLTSGTAATGYLFTDTTSSLSGAVYVDTDADGVRDAGEPGIGGVGVRLTATAGPANGTVRDVTTAADGTWSAAGLRSGTWTVSELAQPAGYLDGREAAGTFGGTLTPPDSITSVVVPVGADGTGYTFGEVLASSLAGSVVSDRGPGVPGVTVTLTGTDELGGPVSLTATTDAAGAWAFPTLRPGTYAVTETQPAGYGPGSVVPGSAGGVVVGANQVTTIVLAAGVTGTGYVFTDTTSSLAGSVFVDADANGVRGAGEPGITGVTVTVTGTDAAGTPVTRSASTDGTGAYRFDGVLAGTYALTETQPGGYLDGQESTGGASGTPTPPDSVTGIALGVGQQLLGYTFGEVAASSLAGTVTADGAGLPGITVTLTGTDDLGNPVSLTTTTDPAGAYAFTALRPGTYAVSETQPAGYGPGTAAAGSAGGVVGGANSVTGILLVAGVPATGYAFTDTTSSFAGAVYVDSDADGVQDAGEPGIPGVTVLLTGTGGAAAGATATVTTGADGSWSATGLLGGTWTVSEPAQPAGYLDGQEAAGSAGGTLTAPDSITGVVLPAGTAATAYTFGEVLASSVSGVVRTDGGTGIAGVVVVLTGTDDLGDPVSLTATTAADGTWTIAVRPGTYTLTETQPAGYGQGSATVGSSGGVVGGPNSVTGIVVAPGVPATGYVFTDATGSLAGAVFVDADGDGVRDAGEPGLSGVTVRLTGTGGAASGVVVEVVTAADGSWTASGLLGGTYTVSEPGQPAGYADGVETTGSLGGTATGGDSVTGVLLPAGGAGSGYLFAELGSGLSGAVYVDTDGDGVRDAGEPGIAGVTVTVTDGGAVTRTTTTGADGTWSVTGLPAGTYAVTESQPVGYADGDEVVGDRGGVPVAPDSVTGIVLGTGQSGTGYLFGERVGIVTGAVFADLDRDGVLDLGEPGVGGVTVRLVDGGGTTVATTVTASDGTYEFGDVTPGDYTIAEDQPAGYGSSTPDSVAVSVGGTTGVAVPFGDTLGRIGDFVWQDLDRDGVQDAGEPGLSGVTVRLLDGAGVVVATVVTGPDGSYRFDVPAGTYRVAVVPPAGLTVSQPGAGSDRAADSDVVQATLTTAPIEVVVADGVPTTRTDVDAGLVPVVRDLSVTVTPDRSSAAVGERVTWTVVVSNDGTVPEAGAVVTVELPAGVRFVEARGGWTCEQSGTTLVCRTDTVVPPGADLPALELVTEVVTVGDLVLQVSVATTDGVVDATPANDDATTSLRAVPAAGAGGSGSGSSGSGSSGSGRLPRTGAELAPWLGTSLLLTAMGAALVVGSRRRRTTRVEVRTRRR